MHGRRTYVAVLTAVVVGTASLAVAAPSSIRAPASVDDVARRMAPSSEPDLAAEQRAIDELLVLINTVRAERGLPFLRLDGQASTAARTHAADMASMRRMQHIGSDGSDGGLRLTRAGYPWTTWGENLGGGFGEPAALVDAWMASESHNSNLLGDFIDVGIGVVATWDGIPYWCVVFASTVPIVPMF